MLVQPLVDDGDPGGPVRGELDLLPTSDATGLLSQLAHEALAQRRELRLAAGAVPARGIGPQVRQLPPLRG
jgi:hypothetical protein